MNTHIFQLFLAIAATAFVVASCGISDRNDHGDADSQQAPDVSAPSICASGPVVIDAAGKVIGKVVDLSHFSFKVRGCDSKWLATLSYNIGPDSVEVLAAAATCTELGLRVATGESIEMNEFFWLAPKKQFWSATDGKPQTVVISSLWQYFPGLFDGDACYPAEPHEIQVVWLKPSDFKLPTYVLPLSIRF